MKFLKHLFLFLSTVRYLKTDQLTGQIKVRLKRKFLKPKNYSWNDKIPDFPGCLWKHLTDLLPPGVQNNCQEVMVNGYFEFLNKKWDVGWPPQWFIADPPKLWRYNLHYFEYLWALDYEHARFLTDHWIIENALEAGGEGWEPYPVSLRITNLLCVFYGKYNLELSKDAVFANKLWKSIYIQCYWLCDNLETHILGNHLLENAVALALAGSCFKGDDAEKWFFKGRKILEKELKEQILDDGVHFELSPMYHCRVVYLLCLLKRTTKYDVADLADYYLNRMSRVLGMLTHPDGGIALLGDSAHNIYNSTQSLNEYISTVIQKTIDCNKNPIGCFSLVESGFYGASDENGNYFICDMGKIGPDYLPAHGHADVFSFELSLSGFRIVVDSGVYDYENSDIRKYCRSTKAHNTVEINGQDQCELWEIFRVGRRGGAYDIKFDSFANGGFTVGGYHDGYRRLPGKPVHHREFVWLPSKGLTVNDIVSSSKHCFISSRLHLHPLCSIDSIKNNTVIVFTPVGKVIISFKGEGNISTEKSFYCPHFGLIQDNTCVVFATSGLEMNIGYSIEKYI